MAEEFAGRHIGPSATETDRMLAAVGVGSLDELVDRAVPEAIHDHAPLALPRASPRPRPSPASASSPTATRCSRRSSGRATRTRSRRR